MKFITQTRFLKMEQQKTKEGKEFLLVSLLDDETNLHRFFVFDEDLREKFLKKSLKELQTMNCAFDLSLYNSSWSVRLIDFKIVEKE